MNIAENLKKTSGRRELACWLNNYGYDAKSERFISCKTDSMVLECNDCGNVHVIPKTCKVRVCPRCDNARRGSTVNDYSKVVNELRNPKRLDLTVKNLDKLTKDSVKDIRDSFTKLRDRLPIKGGIYSIEIKNIGNGWNLHLHAVVDMPYIEQEKISDMWEQITGNPIVWIKKAPNKEKSLYYITKYVTKPPELESIKQAAIYIDVLNHTRLLSKVGYLYGEKISDAPFECNNCGSTNIDWRGSASFYHQFDPLGLDADTPTGHPPPT